MPYVIETSIGLDRLFLCIISGSLIEEELKNSSIRTLLRIPFPLAPVKAAVLPLNAKDGLQDKSRSIFNELKTDISIQYDEKESIGKRYRRQNAIGTPFCITVDYESLKVNTVTIRNRDTMNQERIPAIKAREIVQNKLL